jgi:glucosamine--fructose-6-phosphate aminotransferase (isomerizing)
LREAAHILAEGFDAEGLLHGAAVPYGRGDGLVTLGAFDDPDGLTASVAEAAQESGVTACLDLMAVSTRADAEPGANAARAERLTPSERFLAQIPATVCLQLLAESFARQRGTDPDTVITGAWTRDALWSAGAPTTGEQPR